MINKKLISILLSAGVVVALALIGVKLQTPKEFDNNIVLANVDALLQNESNTEQGSLDTSYSRKTKKCDFYVGANAKVSILGLGIFEADGDGYIHVPEQVTCVADGNETCKPVECIDLLQVIIGHIEIL